MEDLNLNMIACVDEKFAIGKNGELIAFVPKDLKHFREITSNNIIVFGRKTFLGFPNQKPLKNRINILLTSKVESVEKIDDYFYKVNNIKATLNLIEKLKKDTLPPDINNNPEVFICGGEKVYNDFLFLVNKIFLTLINKDLEGDRFFPSCFLESFTLVSKSDVVEENNLSFTFNEYKRK